MIKQQGLCVVQGLEPIFHTIQTCHRHLPQSFSATLTAKLHKCYMASLQIAKTSAQQHRIQSSHVDVLKNAPIQEHIVHDMKQQLVVAKPSVLTHDVESIPQFVKPLEDDHIEQMIEELLDYESIELSSNVTSQ
ncbi:ethylene-responsive transcription factor ERF003-like [Nicotiana tabacum]